jgi:hypothetical protein
MPPKREPPPTPELDRRRTYLDEARALTPFLEFLRDKYAFDYDRRARNEHLPAGLIQLPGDFEQILADYFEIDLERVEAEREALLEWLQPEAAE